MRAPRIVWTLSSLAFALALGAGACSDEHDDHHNGGSGGVHQVKSPSCQEIMNICHAADTEPGPAHDCHGVAHADVEAECATQKTSCIRTCEAVLADAGLD